MELTPNSKMVSSKEVLICLIVSLCLSTLSLSQTNGQEMKPNKDSIPALKPSTRPKSSIEMGIDPEVESDAELDNDLIVRWDSKSPMAPRSEPASAPRSTTLPKPSMSPSPSPEPDSETEPQDCPAPRPTPKPFMSPSPGSKPKKSPAPSSKQKPSPVPSSKQKSSMSPSPIPEPHSAELDDSPAPSSKPKPSPAPISKTKPSMSPPPNSKPKPSMSPSRSSELKPSMSPSPISKPNPSPAPSSKPKPSMSPSPSSQPKLSPAPSFKPKPAPNPKQGSKSPPQPAPLTPTTKPTLPYQTVNNFCLYKRLSVDRTFCLKVLKNPKAANATADDYTPLLQVATQATTSHVIKTLRYLKTLYKDKKTDPALKPSIRECFIDYQEIAEYIENVLADANQVPALAGLDGEVILGDINRCVRSMPKRKNAELGEMNQIAKNYVKLLVDIADNS